MQSNLEKLSSSPREVPWLDESEMRAWRSILLAHFRLFNQLDCELVRAHGITLAEYEVLVHTSESPRGLIRMSQLADAVLVSRSGLTRRINHLVDAGFVKKSRCDEDKRGTFAELTPLGWQVLREAAPTHLKGVRDHLISKLSRTELEALAEALEKVSEISPGDLSSSGFPAS